MVHDAPEGQREGEACVPEIMESLLSQNQLVKGEKYMKQPSGSMRHFGKWLLGIFFIAIALTFMFFVISNVHKRISVQRSTNLLIGSSDQYADQEDTKNDGFDIQQITGILQEASQDIEQLTNLQTEIPNQSETVFDDSTLSRYYNEESENLIEDDTPEAAHEIKLDDEVFTKSLNPLIITEMPETTLMDVNFHNLPAFTATPILPPIANAEIISNAIIDTTSANDNKYKFNAYIRSSSRTFIQTPKHSPESSNFTADNIPSSGRNTNSETATARQFPTFSYLATANSQFDESDGEGNTNQIGMTATEFTTKLQNLRITTVSTPNPIVALLRRVQENMVVLNEKTETEFTPASQLRDHHHYHYQYEHYDQQSLIIVTALFDIGRGKWRRYTRTYEQYMSYLKHLLKLRNCLIIYTDARGAQFVRQMRDSRNTQIFEMSMHDIPLYRYREEIAGIIRREQKERTISDWRFSPNTRCHPEANSADYNIIVNSKPYFLYNATQSARFQISDRMFAWIDAGYGHGQKGIIPNHCHWRPNLQRDRITIIKLTPAHDKVSRYSITDLYRVDWVVLSGGFIAGDSHTINRFYRFYQKLFMELLDSGKIDDDQTVLTLMLKHYTTLFNPISSNGDWYAIFRLFPCHNT
uniref:VWFA domain-containing protein n=1 Tax=Elaeophora elaphi TaxID=1147741 RepID=A0A0R3S5R6_9BILA